MGNNFDRITLIAKYTPAPRVKFDLRYNYIRKGEAGSLWQQYLQEPQPPFLFGSLRKRTDFIFSMQYEWKNNFYLFLKSQQTNQLINDKKTTITFTNIGFSYGL
jgi:cytochrome P450